MRYLAKGMLLFSCLALTSCATQSGLSGEFERSAKTYNRMLRWQEIENAGIMFIEPEQREQYLKQAESLKKRGLSVTDFRILSSKYLPKMKSGDVIAEFDYYILPSNRVKTITYRQEWVYQESSAGWRIKGLLPAFE